MTTPFQRALYRLQNNAWHYILLQWIETHQMYEVCTGLYGHLATPIGEEVLLPGETKETALQRLVLALKQVGYADNPADNLPRPAHQLYFWSNENRVLGQTAVELRKRLNARWNVEKGCWPPLGDAAPCKTLHVTSDGFDEETANKLTDLIQKRVIGQVYAFNESNNIYVTGMRGFFYGYDALDTHLFDDSMEWIVYITHEDTITFAGEWLLNVVRDLYKDRPELLNPWWDGREDA